MRHDSDDVATGVAYAGDIVQRPVRILCDVAQDHLAVGLELGRRLDIGDIPAVAMRDGQCQLFALIVAGGKGRVGRLDAHPHRPRQKLETCVAHQRTGQQTRLTQNLQPIADRKSTRLNSSHPSISYAVFCLKKKKKKKNILKTKKTKYQQYTIKYKQ